MASKRTSKQAQPEKVKRTRSKMSEETKARLAALGVQRTANRPTGSIIRQTTMATLSPICKAFGGHAVKVTEKDGSSRLDIVVKAGPKEVVILPAGASTPAKGVTVVKVPGDVNNVKAALAHFRKTTEGAKYEAAYVGGACYLLK